MLYSCLSKSELTGKENKTVSSKMSWPQYWIVTQLVTPSNRIQMIVNTQKSRMLQYQPISGIQAHFWHRQAPFSCLLFYFYLLIYFTFVLCPRISLTVMRSDCLSDSGQFHYETPLLKLHSLSPHWDTNRHRENTATRLCTCVRVCTEGISP